MNKEREDFLQHEVSLREWAEEMKLLKDFLDAAKDGGDQEAVDVLERRYEALFFERPMRDNE